ncbi:MAG: ABC transporter substrate-binding protein, partial [Ilumatobacteraceae bacterium]
YGPERLEVLGELVGRPDHAAATIDRYDAAMSAAQAAVDDDCVLSLATIYGGPSVAAFVAGPWEIPSTMLEVGCELDPDADDATPDQNGRAWLSLEQLGMLDSDLLVLMQTESVDGESSSVAEIEANPIWQTLPAVRNDNVVVIDRLGYPGTIGQIHLLGELVDVLASS